MEHENTASAGLRAAAPLVLPVLLVGASFGVAATTAGWGEVAPVVMSVVVFAGAAQFAVLSVLAAGGSVLAAVAAATLINLRFLAMGLAIGPWMRGGALRRGVLGWMITDASLVLARLADGRYGAERLAGSFVPQFVGWTLGTAVGVFVGGRIAEPERYGLDALFPAFFLYLLVSELDDPASRASALLAAAIALALIPLTPPGVPVIVACVAVVAGRRTR